MSQVEEVAKNYPDVEWIDMDIDAMAGDVYSSPSKFDVILITNMFGDTLGLAAALDVGDTRAALMERWPIATCERVMCEISSTFTWAIINNLA